MLNIGTRLTIDSSLYPQTVVAPAASADPLTNYNNLMNTITTAGVGGIIMLPFGQTYTLYHHILPLRGQLLLGNNSIMKVGNQIQAQLTATAAINSTVLGPAGYPRTTFTCPSTGFVVGASVGIDDTVVAGTTTRVRSQGVVISAGGGSVVVDWICAQNYALVVESNTTTNLETTTNNYTVNIGAYLVTVGAGLYFLGAADSSLVVRSGVRDLEVDGNRSNGALGARWETGEAIVFYDNACIDNLYVHDTIADGCYISGSRSQISKVWMKNLGAMGFHIGAGYVTGAQYSTLDQINIDTPGLGSAQIGHYGGISNLYPAYPCIGFSQVCDNVNVSNFVFRNSGSSTMATGIGYINDIADSEISFNHGKIMDMSNGAWQIVGSTAKTTASELLSVTDVKVNNCQPSDYSNATVAPSQCSYIGTSSASTPPRAYRLNFSNIQMKNSPVIIQGVESCFLTDFHAECTDLTKSSSIIALGISNDGTVTGATELILDNVSSIRPYGVQTGAPSGSYGYNFYFNGARVRGQGAFARGGGWQFQIQSGADASLNLYGEDAYLGSIRVQSSTTTAELRQPTVRLNSGFTATNFWAGFEGNDGGGASSNVTIINPDIRAVTTNANQHGIGLSPSGTGAAVTVIGGTVNVTGTSTKCIVSGGANSFSSVEGTIINHAWTPNANEIDHSTVNAQMY